MSQVEIDIPEELDVQISQLIEQGEFTDRKEAVQQLLSSGLTAYKTSGSQDDVEVEYEEDGMMSHEEEYVF